MRNISPPPAPPGYTYIFCRFRRVKGSTKVLDAWDYGYQAWCIRIRKKRS